MFNQLFSKTVFLHWKLFMSNYTIIITTWTEEHCFLFSAPNYFALSDNEGSKALVTTSLLDVTLLSYQLTLEVIDGGGLKFNQTLTLNVNCKKTVYFHFIYMPTQIQKSSNKQRTLKYFKFNWTPLNRTSIHRIHLCFDVCFEILQCYLQLWRLKFKK